MVSCSTYPKIVTQYVTKIEKVVSLSLCDGHSGTCVPLLSSLDVPLIVCTMLGCALSPGSMRRSSLMIDASASSSGF